MWDPRADRAPVRRELECSRDPETGVAAAAVLCSRWDARTRLAYEDGSLDAVRIDVGENGATLRRLIPSAINMLHVRLTVTGCEGFPDVDGVPFSFADPAHVGILDPAVWDEVVAIAKDVQAPPTAAAKRPQDRRPAAPAEAGEGGADPTPTPSTPAAPPTS